MKLKDLLEVIAIKDKSAYVELCTICHVENETIFYTYKGCVMKAQTLLDCLPVSILNQDVVGYHTPKEFKFGLSPNNQIVECKKEIYIEY